MKVSVLCGKKHLIMEDGDMNLNGWVLNNTENVLEFNKQDYRVVLMKQEEYGFYIGVFNVDDEYGCEKDFKTLTEALKYIDDVLNGDVEYE